MYAPTACIFAFPASTSRSKKPRRRGLNRTAVWVGRNSAFRRRAFPAGSPPDLIYPGQAIHPSQLYNAFVFLALFALTLWLRPRLKGDGQLWWLFVILFALVRFPIDATRHYEASAYVLRWTGGGMTDSELIGVGLIVVAAFLFWRAGRSRRRGRPAPA